MIQLKSNSLNQIELSDLNGKWYEVAHSANHFEARMSDVRVFLDFIDQRKAEFVFVGATEKGNFYHQYKICFSHDKMNFRIRKINFFGKKLKIVNIDEKSMTIMITDRRCRRLWIFTQTLPLVIDSVNQMIEEAKKMGFDANKLIMMQLE